MSNANSQRIRKMEQEQIDQRERLVRMETKICDIHCLMKETESRPSLPVRVDRLERFQRGVIRIGFAGIVSMLTAAGAGLWALLTGK